MKKFSGHMGVVCFFGEIRDDQMILSPAGRIADFCWQEITDLAKNIELRPYVVMPNHIHDIVILVLTRPALSPKRRKSISGDDHFNSTSPATAAIGTNLQTQREMQIRLRIKD